MRIGLAVDGCEIANTLYDQLTTGDYTWPMSVLALHDDPVDWLDGLGTARKRAVKCSAQGYTFRGFNREDHEDDIYETNTSLEFRQGRRMADGYWLRPDYQPLDQPCDRHRVHAYGVFDRDGVLRAYCFVYRSGDLALVSQILGHGEHLERGVMFLLLTGVYAREHAHGGFLVYNRHDSGTPGLVQFKEWFRFAPERVTWQP